MDVLDLRQPADAARLAEAWHAIKCPTLGEPRPHRLAACNSPAGPAVHADIVPVIGYFVQWGGLFDQSSIAAAPRLACALHTLCDRRPAGHDLEHCTAFVKGACLRQAVNILIELAKPKGRA